MEALIDDFVWYTNKVYPWMGSDDLERLVTKNVRDNSMLRAVARAKTEFAKKVIFEAVVIDGSYPNNYSSGEFCELLHKTPFLGIYDLVILSREDWFTDYEYIIPPVYHRRLQAFRQWIVQTPSWEVDLHGLTSDSFRDFMIQQWAPPSAHFSAPIKSVTLMEPAAATDDSDDVDDGAIEQERFVIFDFMGDDNPMEEIIFLQTPLVLMMILLW